MATVKIIDYTGSGRPDSQWHAADLLLLTKDTRLSIGGGDIEKIKALPEEEKLKLLSSMAQTIPSSWEFVNVTFEIAGVSRAVAQQITRTRTASYAMQSMRVVDGSELGAVNPYHPDDQLHRMFEEGVEASVESYQRMVRFGAKLEDARGVLPLNTRTTLIASYNLRALVELLKARASKRTQGEYQGIAECMKLAVLEVWPWAANFFKSPHDQAIELLSSVIDDLGLTIGSGHGWQIAKAIDLIRKV